MGKSLRCGFAKRQGLPPAGRRETAKSRERESLVLFSKQDLKRLIGPLLLEQALAITVGMIDAMMVSSVGEAASSGASLVDIINNLIFAVLSALATGGAVVTSQYLGGGIRLAACRSS